MLLDLLTFCAACTLNGVQMKSDRPDAPRLAHATVLTSIPEIKAATGFGDGWIFNTLSSRLLQHLWSTDHMDVNIEHEGRSIRIPARFGTRRLLGETGPPAGP